MVSLVIRSHRFAIVLLVSALAIGYAASSAADTGGGTPSRTDKEKVIPPQGDDVEGGPAGEGAEFRRLTPLSSRELNAVDPHFRELVRRIRDGEADKRVMRQYWFLRSRLDPFDVKVPQDWRRRGVAVLRDATRTNAAMSAFGTARRETSIDPPPEGALAGAAARLRGTAAGTDAPGVDDSGVWVPIGPYVIPGRMSSLARPANAPSWLYATAADGGLWLTKDAGTTWKPLTDFESSLSAGSILIDPNDPATLYVGTGEGNASADNYPGIGVLKSTDAGFTWTTSNDFSDEVRRLEMHPDAPSRIFAAGRSGCYVSEDAGATFALISSASGLPNGTRASDVRIRPDDPNTVFCALWGSASSGIYRSTDGGTTWADVGSGLPAGNKGRIAMAISEGNPDVMIAGLDVSNGQVYRSTDGGDIWTALTGSHVGYCSGQCWYDNAVGFDKSDPDVFYAGGVNTYGTTDGGVSWTRVSSSSGGRGAPNYVHVDQHAIYSPAPGIVFVANDGGIFHSTDRGATWDEWSLGMDTTQYYGICARPNEAFWAFGGTQDNGSHRRRSTDDPAWQMRIGADGGMCMTGPDGSDVILGETQNMNIRRSADGGDTWTSANGGIDPLEPKAWVGIMVVDPIDRNNMWAGTSTLYRSTDARATAWDSVSNALGGGSLCGALEVSQTDSELVYAGFANGEVFKSSNALRRKPPWSSIRDPAMPNRGVRRIRSHPSDAGTVYVVFNGFGTGKIWKSTDGGGSFVDRTGDHPDVPINDLFVDAANPGVLLSATDLGVFRSNDDGATWFGFSSGFPTVAAIEFTYDEPSDTLRIGTHGRSIWEWQEASQSPIAVPDGNAAGGTAMTAERIGDSESMRVSWDVRECTAFDYHLIHGDLADVATRTYDGASCNLGTSGFADLSLPTTPSGNAYFVVVGVDATGTEGPHGFDIGGSPIIADAVGFCGIAVQDPLATCP